MLGLLSTLESEKIEKLGAAAAGSILDHNKH